MNDINTAIALLVSKGYLVFAPMGGVTPVKAAPVSAPVPSAAPFGLKLDGTPKKSAAGRPPTAHAHAAAPAPAVSKPVPVAAPDFLDLGDFDAPAPKAAPAKVAPKAPGAPVKAAAPVATSAEDDILSDLDGLLG